MLEPAFRELVYSRVRHPLWHIAHYVKAVDKEALCHFLLKFGIIAWAEYKADDDQVSSDPSSLLWHLGRVVRKRLDRQGVHALLWKVFLEVLA